MISQSWFVAGATAVGGEAADASANFRLSPKQVPPAESSDEVAPLRATVEPLSFRSSPFSPESPRHRRPFLAATSGTGFEGPTALVFAGGQWHDHTPPRVRISGSQRRRGLLAACSTPRSSTPRAATDDLRLHYGGTDKALDGRAAASSSLLHDLSVPASDILSGGVDGMYRWPVTHAYRPEPVACTRPPHTHTRSRHHRTWTLRELLRKPML